MLLPSCRCAADALSPLLPPLPEEPVPLPLSDWPSPAGVELSLLASFSRLRLLPSSDAPPSLSSAVDASPDELPSPLLLLLLLPLLVVPPRLELLGKLLPSLGVVPGIMLLLPLVVLRSSSLPEPCLELPLLPPLLLPPPLWSLDILLELEPATIWKDRIEMKLNAGELGSVTLAA